MLRITIAINFILRLLQHYQESIDNGQYFYAIYSLFLFKFFYIGEMKCEIFTILLLISGVLAAIDKKATDYDITCKDENGNGIDW